MSRLTTRLKKILRNPLVIFYYGFESILWLMTRVPYFHFVRNTKDSETAVTLRVWFMQKVVGINKEAYWPMHTSSIVTFWKNVYAGIDTCPGYNPGVYVHAVNKIYIGDYTQIGPNVGLMSGNHDLYDFRIQVSADPIRIGKYCWIGMGAVIMPGVQLGDFSIVGAGSIVTKSFEGGHCVIAGNPAKKIRDLERYKCIPFTSPTQYNGYIPHHKFEEFRIQFLNV